MTKNDKGANIQGYIMTAHLYYPEINKIITDYSSKRESKKIEQKS
jgi:hypothetical protein